MFKRLKALHSMSSIVGSTYLQVSPTIHTPNTDTYCLTSLGVLKPKPTFLTNLSPFFFLPPPRRTALLFWKVSRCF